MMTRVLIIYRVDKSQPENTGVVKKLIGQVEGLEVANCKVDYVIHDTKHIYLNNKPIYDINVENVGAYFKWNFFNCLYNIELINYDICIIRYGLSSLSFLKFLKAFRKENKKAQLLVDMPTYPYKLEHVGLKGKVKIIIDNLLRIKLYELVDYVMHSGEHSFIFNIPTVKISNGISCKTLRVRSYKERKGLRMIAVGKWRYWHGLDRLINGMAQMTNAKEIKLDIVGEGPELDNLKKLVLKNGLERRVLFHGVCVGGKLDRLFDQADVGVGTLGLFRKGVVIDSSLKNREYLARGLPVIMSSEDADIKSGLDFVYKVPEDDSIIDVVEIEDFVNNLNVSETIKETRTFAENHLSWRSKMKTLLKEIGALR